MSPSPSAELSSYRKRKESDYLFIKACKCVCVCVWILTCLIFLLLHLQYSSVSLFLQAPATTSPGTLAQYIDHVLLLDGSSFIIGEVNVNASITHLLLSQHSTARPVPTVYSVEPTPDPKFSTVCEIVRPGPSFPSSREMVSNSTDLGAKVADSVVISLWWALKKLLRLRFPYPKSHPVSTSMPEFHPIMAAALDPR